MTDRQARYHEAMQKETREQATHHQKPWQADEINLACDRSIPIQEAALALGRTRAAVTRIRQRMSQRTDELMNPTS